MSTTPTVRVAAKQALAVTPHIEAWAGQHTSFKGKLRYVFNNGRQVPLGFSNLHRGGFKALIRQTDWKNFDTTPECYRVGQTIQVTGLTIEQ